MSDMVAVPRAEWENIKHTLNFLKQVIVPLAKGYKPGKWMTEAEVMEYLQVGKRRIGQLRESGQIVYQKPVHGRATEYSRKDIEDYKAGHIVIASKTKQS